MAESQARPVVRRVLATWISALENEERAFRVLREDVLDARGFATGEASFWMEARVGGIWVKQVGDDLDREDAWLMALTLLTDIDPRDDEERPTPPEVR